METELWLFLQKFAGQVGQSGPRLGDGRARVLSLSNLAIPYATEHEIIYTVNFPHRSLYLIFDLEYGLCSALTVILSAGTAGTADFDRDFEALCAAFGALYGSAGEREIKPDCGAAEGRAAYLRFGKSNG